MAHERQRRYERRKATEAADIGQVPAVVNPERRDRCRLDANQFLVEYFPRTTGRKPFSPEQRRLIERTQISVLTGGLFLSVFPRGFAKSTVSENTTLWAALYGHRKFIPLFGASRDNALSAIESIKLELQENDLLAEDFPEVCHPIRALEGKPQRCASQTHDGERTYIEWKADSIVLPTIAGSAASGVIIKARGINAAGRGMRHKGPDGLQRRPDYFVVDDPQTDQTAATPLQINKLLSVIRKSILKMGAHDRKIAGVINATVIRAGDMVEQMFDPKKFPAWQGERVKMVKKWADAHETHWLGEYARLRNTYDRSDPGAQASAHAAATDYYKANRAAMDAGCVVTWEHCYDEETELTAIQHAYNLLIDDGDEVFASECQNEPLASKVDDQALKLTVEELARKLNNQPRRLVPAAATKLLAFIDPKKDLLYYGVVAVGEGFSAWVVDYGTYPDQKKSYFGSRKVAHTLQKATKESSWEAALYAGLDNLVDQIAGVEWHRDDGTVARVDRCLIDHGWGQAKETVDLFCRQSKHAAILLASKGVYAGASSRPFSDYRPKPGDRVGDGWRVPAKPTKHSARSILFDANLWKAFMISRLKTGLGGRGSLSVYGDDPSAHGLLFDHFRSEDPVAVEAKGRQVVEFKQRPGQDNDWLDCIVGCLVGASEQRISLHQQQVRVRKRVKISELAKKSKHWKPR